MLKGRGLVWLTMVMLAAGCGSPASQAPQPGEAASRPSNAVPADQEVTAMKISSPAFGLGQPIPSRFTCDGEDVSPALAWSGVPSSAKSLTLVCDDPDAPAGTWTHWIVSAIPPAAAGIPENGPLPAGAVEITNSFGRTAYGGPCPPGGTHRYFFRLYALDVERIGGLTLSNYRTLLPQHAVAQAEWMGTYRRK